MQKGFNSDIEFSGKALHLQTEDWGYDNPFLVSKVFCQGAIVWSTKISYDDILPKGLASGPKAIQIALLEQHKKILDLLLSGKLL